ncbi:MAG: rod shape-determining protein MreD [Flavobacteriales bacterium]|nr:rod shape-determining protein MreD [Flavobacteriales bacterium]
MTINIIRHIISFILLALLQVFVLNNVNINGFINPQVFIMFLLLLPINAEIWLCLIAGFVSGAIMDGLSNTYGIHAFSGTALGYFRYYYIKYSLDKETIEKAVSPNIRNINFGWHLLYLGICSVFYHWLAFLMESFTFAGITIMSQKALISGLLAAFLMILIGFIFSKKTTNV